MFVDAAGRTAIARSIESESSSRRVLSATRSPGESGGRGPQVLRPEVAADEAATTQLHPGITQEVAPNESQRSPKPATRKALIYEALFVARWRQRRFEKGS